MEPDTMERIFNPYFTTKNMGDGTGLGLAVVQGIVTSHGGAITVESRPGAGSTFHILLPRVVSETASLEKPKTTGQLPKGRERILVVDDEDTLVEISAEMLGNLGYDVTTRTSSQEALDLVISDPNAFDLVISDMTMPMMTGADLAVRILDIRPDIPIVIYTGYSTAIDPEKARQIGVRELIMKPVDYQELAIVIRRLLDSKDEGLRTETGNR